MLLMVENSIRGGTCHALHRYTKANNKYMNDYDKNKDTSHLKHWDLNNLHRWKISQKNVDGSIWVENTSLFKSL